MGCRVLGALRLQVTVCPLPQEGSHHHTLDALSFMGHVLPATATAVKSLTADTATAAARVAAHSGYSNGSTKEKPTHMTIVSGMPTRRKSVNV